MLPLERHQPFLTPEMEVTNRISKFQKTLQKNELSLAWIDYPPDRYYFTGTMQDGALIIPTDGSPLYFARKSLKRAEIESPLDVLPWPGRKGLINQIRKVTGTNGRIGLPMDVVPAATYCWLTEKTGCHISDISMLLKTQKAVKSDWEIGQIKKAAEQADIVFGEMQKYIRPGNTELETSASIEKRLRELGHTGTIRVRRPGMDLGIIHVVSGNSALYPTNFDGPVGGEGLYHSSPAGPGWKKINKNESIMVDMVTAVNGYHSDQTRIFYTGDTIPKVAKDAHQYCREVLEQLEEKVRPGSICQDVYLEIKEWTGKQGEPEGFMGYGENQVKFFGHGIGLELDEFPIIADRIDMELQTGMVLAMEPKAFLKGIGGFGLENTYRVTETGCESLNSADEEIIKLV